MHQNEAVFAQKLLRLEEELKSFPKETISCKHRKHGIEYYRQVVQDDGSRKEYYVRKADVPQVLKQFEKKKQVKQRLGEMKHQLSEMSPPDRRRFRAAIALGREWNVIKSRDDEKKDEWQNAEIAGTRSSGAKSLKAIPTPAEIFMTGLHTRSRAELICLAIASFFDMKILYEPAIQTNDQFIHGEPPYIADFLVISPVSGRTFVWEHLGQLSDPNYLRHQRQKMKEYRRSGYLMGKNLIVTTSYRHVNEQRILWDLIRGGVLDARTVRRKLRKLSEMIQKVPNRSKNAT